MFFLRTWVLCPAGHPWITQQISYSSQPGFRVRQYVFWSFWSLIMLCFFLPFRTIANQDSYSQSFSVVTAFVGVTCVFVCRKNLQMRQGTQACMECVKMLVVKAEMILWPMRRSRELSWPSKRMPTRSTMVSTLTGRSWVPVVSSLHPLTGPSVPLPSVVPVCLVQQSSLWTPAMLICPFMAPWSGLLSSCVIACLTSCVFQRVWVTVQLGVFASVGGVGAKLPELLAA